MLTKTPSNQLHSMTLQIVLRVGFSQSFLPNRRTILKMNSRYHAVRKKGSGDMVGRCKKPVKTVMFSGIIIM